MPKKKRRPTPHTLLGQAMLREGVTSYQLAKEFGISTQAVLQWLDGMTRPSLEHMIKIQKRFGIELAAWAR